MEGLCGDQGLQVTRSRAAVSQPAPERRFQGAWRRVGGGCDCRGGRGGSQQRDLRRAPDDRDGARRKQPIAQRVDGGRRARDVDQPPLSLDVEVGDAFDRERLRESYRSGVGDTGGALRRTARSRDGECRGCCRLRCAAGAHGNGKRRDRRTKNCDRTRAARDDLSSLVHHHRLASVGRRPCPAGARQARAFAPPPRDGFAVSTSDETSARPPLRATQRQFSPQSSARCRAIRTLAALAASASR